MHGAGTRSWSLALLAAACVVSERLPDPRADAARAARAAEEFAVARTLAGRAPREPAGHLVAAALAQSAGDFAALRSETDRAVRATPWQGEVLRAAAEHAVIDAVLHADPARLELAAERYAAAVTVGALSIDAALQALQMAAAPTALLEIAAGRERSRREALVDHLARCGEGAAALALAARIDAEQGGAHCRSQALAERRLGAFALAERRAAAALAHFDRAARFMGDEDALRRDRAVAAFAAGDPATGALHLERALASGAVAASEISALLAAAPDPARARSAWHAAGGHRP